MHSPQYLQQLEVVSFINLGWNIQNEILSTLYILFSAHISDSLNDKKKETEINLMCSLYMGGFYHYFNFLYKMKILVYIVYMKKLVYI